MKVVWGRRFTIELLGLPDQLHIEDYQRQGPTRMAGLQNEVDAGFFNLIHRLSSSAEPKGAAGSGGGRSDAALAKPRIAPQRGQEIPSESEYDEVQCCDLTRSGFSFLFPRRPNFDSLVAAFGTPPEVIYIAARVTRCEPALVDASGRLLNVEDSAAESDAEVPGERAPLPMVLVHCHFVERLRT